MTTKVTQVKPLRNSEYEKDHFILNRWILRGAGLWAPETKSKIIKIGFNCYAVIVFLFVNLFFTPTEFVSIKDTYKNLNALIKNLSFALTHLLGAIKVLFWYYRNKELRRIMNILESEELHYESKDDFQPAEIFRKAKRTGMKYTFTFYMMAHVTVSSSYIPPIVTTFTNPNYIENEQGNLTFYQPLPYFSWIPFSIDTPKSYLYALAYQMGPMYSYAYSIVGMDTLFMNILNLTGAHMSVLKGAFRSIRGRCVEKMEKMKLLSKDEKSNKDLLDNMMRNEYKRSVKHIQTIFA
ncbi:hypothetical protein ILUMI_01491 [Ignelater luminosus]|uniref:Odorant receptor n=1 Tax=Ignelater luminosus TaxID=2038154 RepID=A0A8K0DEB5_IGNLU|nr:hypothetical protein ILUMI_01491 [Ignelater luminosus]